MMETIVCVLTLLLVLLITTSIKDLYLRYDFMILNICIIYILQIVLATASPDKFPEAVEKAGVKNKVNPEIEKLFSMETRSEAMKQGDDWEQMLRNKIDQITKLRR